MSFSFPVNSKLGSGYQENNGLSLAFFFFLPNKSALTAPRKENCKNEEDLR